MPYLALVYQNHDFLRNLFVFRIFPCFSSFHHVKMMENNYPKLPNLADFDSNSIFGVGTLFPHISQNCSWLGNSSHSSFQNNVNKTIIPLEAHQLCVLTPRELTMYLLCITYNFKII